MRVDLFDFDCRRSASRCARSSAARGGAAARACARAAPEFGDQHDRRSAGAASPRRRPGFQRYAGAAGAAHRRAARAAGRRRRVSASRCTNGSRRRMARLHPAGAEARVGDRHRFSAEGLRSRARRRTRARTARSACASIRTGRCFEECLAAHGAHATAALYRGEAQGGRAGRAAIIRPYSPRAGCGRRADGRPAFHAGAARSSCSALASDAAFRDAACRRRARSCRSRRTTPPITACTPSGAKYPADTAGPAQSRRARQAAVSSRSARRRCACSKAPPTRTASSAHSAATRRFSSRRAIASRPSTRSSPISICRDRRCSCWCRAFSGLETMKRAYAHAIACGYRFYSYGDACCSCRRRSQRGSARMTSASSFTPQSAGRRRASRRDRHVARHHPHARLHAGRHGGDRQGDVHRPRCARPAPTSFSATPIT